MVSVENSQYSVRNGLDTRVQRGTYPNSRAVSCNTFKTLDAHSSAIIEGAYLEEVCKPQRESIISVGCVGRPDPPMPNQSLFGQEAGFHHVQGQGWHQDMEGAEVGMRGPAHLPGKHLDQHCQILRPYKQARPVPLTLHWQMEDGELRPAVSYEFLGS